VPAIRPSCELCDSATEAVLWRDDRLRVVRAGDADHPAFCRVIWRRHVAEMTDLDEAGRAHLMHVVWAVERALRDTVRPDKINLASLGNRTPHLHWHVIARFRDDARFPDSVWSEPRREAAPRSWPEFDERLRAWLMRELGTGTG
jgi:diadenosine tetraphosphate (Ap4A) HIT family hydrolase